VVLEGPASPPETILGRGAKLLIGRATHCGICVDDAAVSREHALLRVAAYDVTIEDLGSHNGVLLNRVPLGAQPRVLADGDELTIATARLRYEGVAGPPVDSTDVAAAAATVGTSPEVPSNEPTAPPRRGDPSPRTPFEPVALLGGLALLVALAGLFWLLAT
jgi:hypothetical protein